MSSYVTNVLVYSQYITVCICMYSYVNYSYVLVCTRMLITRMYSYVLVCYRYVTLTYSFVTRMLLVCYSYVTRMYSCGVLVRNTRHAQNCLQNFVMIM